MKLLKLFATEELIELVVKETKRYATQYIQSFAEIVKTLEVEGCNLPKNKNFWLTQFFCRGYLKTENQLILPKEILLYDTWRP